MHQQQTEHPYESWTETAYDWMIRWQRKQSLSLIPKDPSSAAWSFLRPRADNVSLGGKNHMGGTGINFIDSVLKRRINSTMRDETTNIHSIPVVCLHGEHGKTWTLMSLAARFVVATRQSNFPEFLNNQDQTNRFSGNVGRHLPSVIILDSKHDVTLCKLLFVIRSTLLRDMNSSSGNEMIFTEMFKQDMEDCLSRIHIATILEDSAGWIPILECIRSQLLPIASVHPTLILWDGFLSEPCWTDAVKLDIVRQVELLLRDCSVFLVITSSTIFRKQEWVRFVTDRIRLNWKSSKTDPDLSELEAVVNGSIIPFSISSAGILS